MDQNTDTLLLNPIHTNGNNLNHGSGGGVHIHPALPHEEQMYDPIHAAPLKQQQQHFSRLREMQPIKYCNCHEKRQRITLKDFSKSRLFKKGSCINVFFSLSKIDVQYIDLY